jgi:hypothetical protein
VSMTTLRSPLLFVGLALGAFAAALCFFDGSAAQPLVRVRTESVRADEPERNGIDPAVASATPKPRPRQKEEASPTAQPLENGSLNKKRSRSSKAAAAEPEEPPAPHCIVEGRCVRDGQPIANMDFVLVPQNGKGRRQNLRTDEDGRFRRGLAGAGTFELRAVGPGLSAHQRTWTVELAEGKPCELGDLVLRPRIAVRGSATALDGSKGIGAVVTLTREDGTSAGETITGDDGTFAFEDVPEGALRIDVQRDAAHGRARVTADGTAAELAAALVLRPRADLTWTLRDDDGRPVEGARLVSVDDDQEAASDAMGLATMRASVGGRVRIDAGGCAPTDVEVDAATSVRRIVLQRVRELRGKAAGASAGAQVWLGLCDGDVAHPFVADALQKPHTVDAEGNFTVPGLVAGRYTVRAQSDNGCSELRTVALPDEPFVALAWTAGTTRVFTVRNDAAEPVAFATAEIASKPDAAPRTFRADHRGQLVVAFEPGENLTMRVRRAGHLDTQHAVDLNADAADLAVTLERATVLDGRIPDYRPDAPYALQVVAWRKEQDPRSAMELPLEVDGTFRSPECKQGVWHVALRRRDRTQQGPVGGAQPLDVPLLADGIDSRTTTIVDSKGGQRSQLILPLPPIPEIHGVVRQNGRPVAGATVFACVEGGQLPMPIAKNPLGFDQAHAAGHFPRATTDAEGKFRMLAGKPGVYAVRVRVEGQPFATGPFVANVRSYEDRAELELALPTAVVRGRLATAAKSSLAFLVPFQDAARDPYRNDDGPAEVQSRVPQRMLEDGVFEFPAVAPGRYVLRLMATGRIVRQRIVEVGTEPVDLGEVTEAPIAKPARIALPVAAKNGATAALLQRMPEVPLGAFHRRLPVQDNAIALRDVPAGNYLVVVTDGAVQVGEPFEIVLRGDGTAQQIAKDAPAAKR